MRKTPFWAHFEHFWAKKFVFTSFFLILTKFHFAKLKKKLISRFQATLVSDGHTDGQP